MVPNHESSGIFKCENCNYQTSRKSQYNRHLSTDKHKILQNPTSKQFLPSRTNLCVCGKSYRHSSSLYAHKKQCNILYKPNKCDTIDKDELIIQLLKQHTELLEILKNGTNNVTHTNSHNKAFNLQFFLNETCKNAMNITDFVDSIKLQLSDLMEVGELGYVEGISKIIMKNLSDIEETERPIHCTDKKRETIYIKDQDQWSKEDEKKSKLRKVIKSVANKNIKLLPQFREKYPEYNNSSSKISDKYDKMVIEVMTTDSGKDEKIIKNISNATVIQSE